MFSAATHSLVGMTLFGTLFHALPATAAAMPSKRVDFTSFGAALLTMLRVFTLDGWTAALQQLLRCEGVEYLFAGSAPYAQRCEASPVRRCARREIWPCGCARAVLMRVRIAVPQQQAAPLFLISFTLSCTYVIAPLATAVVFDAHRACSEWQEAAPAVAA
jgi:hypothetical protein